MAQNIVLPKLGITMTEGTITKWLKQEGEFIREGEPLFEIETDKSTQEWNCNVSGYVKKLLVDEGDTVLVTSPIAIIGEQNETIGGAVEPPTEAEAAAAQAAPLSPAAVPIREGRVNATPRARKYAKAHGLAIADIAGSGERGRVREADVVAHLERLRTSRAETPAVSAKMPPMETTPAKPATPAQPGAAGVLPYQGIRKLTGDRLYASYHDKPHIYVTMEINMQRVTDKRKQEKENGGAATIADYIVEATAQMLVRFPQLNAYFNEDGHVLQQKVNLGYAVNTERGLVVPVLQNATQFSVSGIAAQRRALVKKALDGKLTLAELEGGTFTISSMGAYGVHSFTSIINPPQVAILSVAGIQQRAVIERDAICIRPILYVTMAADHRAIDGALVAQALQHLKERLES